MARTEQETISLIQHVLAEHKQHWSDKHGDMRRLRQAYLTRFFEDVENEPTNLRVETSDAYSFIANRQTAIADSRYALDRISTELLLIESADLISATTNQIEFEDNNGVDTSFELGSYNGQTALMRDNEPMIVPVSNFEIKYYDDSNTETAVLDDIRKIEVAITTAEIGNEGNVVLTGSIFPRNFIYDNYQ